MNAFLEWLFDTLLSLFSERWYWGSWKRVLLVWGAVLLVVVLVVLFVHALAAAG